MIRVLVISNGKPEKEAGQGVTNWDISAQLSTAGEKTAKHLCSRIKEIMPHCQVFGGSPLIKAQQTIFAIMDEIGIKKEDRYKNFYPDTAFWSFSPEIWQLKCCPSKYSNREVYANRPADVTQEGVTVINGIIRLQKIAKVTHQEYALAVSHRGPLDAAIMVAKRALGQKVNITDVRACEGAIFHFGAFAQIIRVEDFLRE